MTQDLKHSKKLKAFIKYQSSNVSVAEITARKNGIILFKVDVTFRPNSQSRVLILEQGLDILDLIAKVRNYDKKQRPFRVQKCLNLETLINGIHKRKTRASLVENFEFQEKSRLEIPIDKTISKSEHSSASHKACYPNDKKTGYNLRKRNNRLKISSCKACGN